MLDLGIGANVEQLAASLCVGMQAVSMRLHRKHRLSAYLLVFEMATLRARNAFRGTD